MNYLEELRSHYGLTQQALAQQAGVGKSTIVKIEAGAIQPRSETLNRLAEVLKVKPGDLAVKLKKAAEDKPAQGDDTNRRHEIVIEELSNPALLGNCAEALIFVALVQLFQARLAHCYVRPEVYAGYVEAVRQAVEQADHLARGIYCESQANSVTNGELGIFGKEDEMAMAVKAFNRWVMTHAPELEEWAGLLPSWADEDLTYHTRTWERLLSSSQGKATVEGIQEQGRKR
jgi:transcriptional regulator with XRE-family HTH domain